MAGWFKNWKLEHYLKITKLKIIKFKAPSRIIPLLDRKPKLCYTA